MARYGPYEMILEDKRQEADADALDGRWACVVDL